MTHTHYERTPQELTFLLSQFWKSNAMYWCDYCKVWMNDNPATKATHENGLKHKDMVAKSKQALCLSAAPCAACTCRIG